MFKRQQNTEPLLGSLTAVRRRVRLLLVADGLGRLVAAVVGLGVALGVLDWLVRFPDLMRLGFLASGIFGVGWWAYARVWRPATARITLDQLALVLGRLTPESRDRLASAVAYVQHGATGSPELWQKVLSNAVHAASRLPLHRALTSQRPARATLAAVVALAACGAMRVLEPALLDIGIRRLVTPLAPVAWPRSTDILALTHDGRAIFDEGFVVEMRLHKGDSPSERAFVNWESVGERPRREMMRRDADGVYRFTLERLRASTRYWFEAGDDDTTDAPGTVAIVRRPAIEAARFVFRSPNYTGDVRETVHSLEEPQATTVQGSQARFEVIADKPLEDQCGRLVFEDGSSLPLARDAGSDRAASATFVAEKTVNFLVELMSRDGLASTAQASYRLDVKEDEAPTVTIVAPRATVEATPTGTINLRLEAGDDFGLTRVSLMARRGNTEPVIVAGLLDSPGASRVAREWKWNLEGLALSPGDTIEYHVEAVDNYRVEERTHAPARSAIQRILILSERQFAEKIGREMAQVRQGIRQLLADLERTRGRTTSLAQILSDAAPLDGPGRSTAERLGEDLRRAAGGARTLSRNLVELLQRVRGNGTIEEETIRQAESAERALSAVGATVLPEAAADMARASDETDVVTQTANVRASGESQDVAAAAIRKVLGELERSSDYDLAVRTMHDLLDRQEAMQRDVVTLARKTAGVEPAKLEAADKAELNRLVESQERLGRDAGRTVERLAELSRRLQDNDPAGSDSLARSIDAAERAAVTRRMDEAARAIKANQTGRARSLQGDAAEGLRTMLTALEERPKRELERLAKAVRDVLTDLDRIMGLQKTLNGRTLTLAETAEGSGALWEVAERQWTLRGTTAALIRRVETKEPRGQAAQVELEAAAEEMKAAAEALRQGSGNGAIPRQETALAALTKAQSLLKEVEQHMDQRLAEQSLAAITAALKKIQQTQGEMRGDTAALADRVRPDQSVSRADGLRLNKLAAGQRELRKPLDDVKSKMTQSIVYQRVCEDIGEQMERASKALAERAVPVAVGEQDRILRALARLIDAVREEQREDRAEFAGGDGAGSAAVPTVSKPIPTLAELKVLRMLQQDVNEETASIHRASPDADARSEDQLRQIERIGQRQRDIQQMAEKMIEAASPGGGP